MDAVIVRLVREAVAGDWEAVGLLLDRLEDLRDKRQEQLLQALGLAQKRIVPRAGGIAGPSDIARALGEVRSWLRFAFWAELLDGGPKALLARMAALEKECGCNEGPHPLMGYASGMQAPAAEMWQEPLPPLSPLRPTVQEIAQARDAVQRFVRDRPADLRRNLDNWREAQARRESQRGEMAPEPPEEK